MGLCSVQNGVISAEELAKILGDSPDNVSKCIAEYDLDHDGMINYEVGVGMCVSVAARVLRCVCVGVLGWDGVGEGIVWPALTPCVCACVCVCVCVCATQEFMRMVLPKDLKYKISCYA